MSRVVRRILLGSHHKPTGAVRHYRHGARVEPAHALAVVQFDQRSFNLIHFDPTGSETADTFHETLDDAYEQAEREFGIRPEEWRVVSEPY